MKTMRNVLAIVVAALMSCTAAAQNYGLDLDGTNDKIGVVDATSLNPTTALTVEAWINADTWKSTVWAGVIVGKQSTSPDRGYCLSVGENGKAEFTVAVANAWVAATSPAVMGLNSWYHVAGVFDGSSVKIYINGELQASTATSGVISPSTGTVMYIGENPTWSGRYFDGTVDEVRIWNVARSTADIQSAFAAELASIPAGLAAYYKMNENTGTTVYDATTNANNGTMLNMDAATDWVPGFIVSPNDVGVVGIARPSLMGTGFSGAETISVEIKNFGTAPISGFDVMYSLNGGAAVSENVGVTIQPFGTYIHTFAAPVNLSGQSSCTLKAYTSLLSDMNTSNDTLSKTLSQTLLYPIFNNVQHNNSGAGQNHELVFYMPDSLSAYSQILLHIGLTCPTGGCDPWDQLAYIKLVKDGRAYELARYITPFGVACGGWTFDITDFRQYLTGKVTLTSFVQVWGSSGWMVNCSLELIPGTPTYKYVTIQTLWDKDYQVYGDPAISYNLTDTLVYLHPGVQAAKIRLTTTGHGQGNTSNAAEFYNATHNIKINGAQAFAQNLWKSNCGSNSCSPQSGTYTTSRAGWCPGQDVQPQFFDLSGLYSAGSPLTADYVLQSYTNSLNTGYNGGSHTEPYLRIKGYLVSYSNNDITTSTDGTGPLDADPGIMIFPNPVQDQLTVYCMAASAGPATLEILDVVGKRYLLQSLTLNSGENYHELSLSDLPAGLYFVKVTTGNGVVVRRLVKN